MNFEQRLAWLKAEHEVYFTLHRLDLTAVGALCADRDYKTRVTFLPNAKEPTLRLKLASGPDSLRQSKIFIDHFRAYADHQ